MGGTIVLVPEEGKISVKHRPGYKMTVKLVRMISFLRTIARQQAHRNIEDCKRLDCGVTGWTDKVKKKKWFWED